MLKSLACIVVLALASAAAAQQAPLPGMTAHLQLGPVIPVDTDSPERAVRQAHGLLLAGRYREADRLLAQPLVSLGSAPLFRMSGLARAGSGDLEGARQQFRTALEIDGNDAPTTAALGLVALRLGRDAEAEALLERLERRKQRCDGRCRDAAAIGSAATALRAAIG
jgi:tetratricopeptide (TPR) repeat protein